MLVMLTLKVFVYAFECNILSTLFLFWEENYFYQFILLVDFLNNFFTESFKVFVTYKSLLEFWMFLVIELSYGEWDILLFVRIISWMKFDINGAYFWF